jgi:hypothetical protein
MTLYYSDDYRDELIELSDEHIMWYIKFGKDDTDIDYELFVRDMIEEFFDIYETDLILTGRSGRHVCVKNTPDNRRQLMNMQRTVYRLQNEVLKRFDDGWRLNKYGTLYHVNGSVCIGSVDGRDIITRHA